MDLDPLSILSWNLQGWRDHDEHTWSSRSHLAAQELVRNRADLIGFQEFAENNLDAVREVLPTYGSELGKLLGENVYTPLFWNNLRIRVHNTGGFYLNEDGTKSRGWDAQDERTATWMTCHDSQVDRELLFINVHLDHIGYVARERSIQLLLDYVSRNFEEDVPIIITGDFNLNLNRVNKRIAPKSRPYGMLTEAGFVDVLHTLHGIWPPPSTFHNYEGKNYQIDEWNTWDIDRIFVRNLRPVRARIIPADPAASDHYPIYCEVTHTDPTSVFRSE